MKFATRLPYIAFAFQIIFFVLFFSTLLARVSEPYASVLCLTIACFGIVVGFFSLIKGEKSLLITGVIFLSLLMLAMFVFATLLSGM